MTNVSFSSNQMNIYPNLSLGVFLKSPALEVTPFWGSRFQGPGRLAAWSLLDGCCGLYDPGWSLDPKISVNHQRKEEQLLGTTKMSYVAMFFLFPSSLPLWRGGFPVRRRRALGFRCAPKSPCSDKFPGHAEPWGGDSLGGALRTSSLPLAISVASWRYHWYDHWWLMIIVWHSYLSVLFQAKGPKIIQKLSWVIGSRWTSRNISSQYISTDRGTVPKNIWKK